jgi:hypothetical protein
MPTIISGDGTITGLTATGISAVQNLPATGSFSTLGVTGDLSFNSGYGSSAVAYGCRAWVNFNGTGTVAIRGSGNVSSITDIATGKYRVNFTTALPDANYGANVSVSSMPTVSDANLVSTDADGGSRVNPTTTTFNLTTFSAQFNALDIEFIRVAVFR